MIQVKSNDSASSAQQSTLNECRFASAVLDTTPAFVTVIDAEGRVVFFNHSCEQLTGYTADEVRGKYVWELACKPDDVEPIKQAFQNISGGQYPTTYESFWVTKKGHRRQISWKNTVLLDAKQQIEYIIGTGVDITDDQDNIIALTESEAKYRAMFDAAPEAIFVETIEGHILDCNEAACQMFGYTHEELVHLSVEDLVPDEIKASLPGLITEELTTGGLFIEAYNKRKNGESFPCQVSTRLATVNQTQVVIVHIRDLTEREAMIQALRDSESRFRRMADNIQNGLTIVEQGRIVYVNNRLCEIFSRDQATMMNAASIEDFIVPEEKANLAQITDTARTEGKTIDESEYWIIRPDGKRRCIRNRYSDVRENTKVVSQFIVTSDITEQKYAEEALRRQALTFENMFDAVLLTNADGKIIDCNPACLRVFGYSREELLGQSPSIIHLPSDRPGLQEKIQWGILKDRRWVDEVKFVRKDGTQGYLDIVVVPVSDEQGNYVTTLGVNRDITARKEAEQALMRHDAILEAISFAAEQFIGEAAWNIHIQRVIARLGKAAQVSRVYLFENHLASNGQLMCSQRYEWVAEGISVQIDNKELQSLPYREGGLERWARELQDNRNISGHVYDFPETERTVLEPQGIYSILVVPIFAGQEWWGFIGFDECTNQRDWSPAEMDALRTAAGILGAAILSSRNKQVRQATLEISEAAHSAQTLDEIFYAIHTAISQLMPADNFYIALYDEDDDLLSFPYFVDQFDEPTAPGRPGNGLTEYVLRTGQPLLASPEVFTRLVMQGEVKEIGSPSIDWLGVPLKADEKTVGVLVVQSYTEGIRFSETDKDILMFVSTQVAMAIERKRAENALQRQLKELTVLHNLALAGTNAASENDLIEQVTDIIGNTFFPDNFGLLLLDESAQVLRFHPSYREITPEFLGYTIPIGSGITGRVAATGQPIRITNATTSADYFGLFFTAKSELCVPIKLGERVIGVINAESAKINNFTEDDQRLLVTLAGQIAISIERRRMEEARRTSEQHYRTLVETSPDAVMLTQLDGTILLCNQQTAKLNGVDAVDAIIGLNAFDLIIPEERESAKAAINQRLYTYEVHNSEYTVLRSDGSSFLMEMSIRAIPDAHGQPNALLGVGRDITARKQREREREAILAFAASIRAAQTRQETVSAVLENALQLLDAQGTALINTDASGQLTYIESARGVWVRTSGSPLTNPKTSQMVVDTGQAFLSNSAQNDTPMPLSLVRSAACIPLMAQGLTLGVLWVGRAAPISGDDIRLLTAIGDIAANAIYRATLHEQTQRRVNRLAALRTVDMAINSSLDLQVALNVLLDQLTLQLNVDACDVLLFNPFIQCLEYSASRGFRTYGITRARIKLGEGITGRAALERHGVRIPNLFEAPGEFIQQRGLAGESFVAYYAVPLIAKGQLKGMLELFHRSPLNSDAEWLNFLETLGGQAAIAIDNATLFNDLQRSNIELELAYDTTLEGWIKMLDLRDQETEGHTKRVTESTLVLARAIGIPENELINVRRGSLLHDIGKMAIPDGILRKPYDLTGEEWETMRKHPTYAYDLLWPITYLRPSLDIPYCHHEKWDGSGYPRGLKGEQIPLVARVFSVIDVWDALRNDRPYRKGWPMEKIKTYLQSQAGRFFDPQVVQTFMRLLENSEI